MGRDLNGAELTRRVEETLGSKLKNAEFVAALFDTCNREGIPESFRDLGLYAKSFQKVAKLLSADGVDSATGDKARTELEGFLKKFSDLVASILSKIPPEEAADIRARFLLPTAESFTNLKGLLDDFVKVKNFMLVERDRGSDIR